MPKNQQIAPSTAPRFFLISPASAGVLVTRMRFLANPEVLADTFEFAEPDDFNAEQWADLAQSLERDLKTGTPIEMTLPAISLLVESLEGSCLAGKGAGALATAKAVAHRLALYIGRPVRPDLV